MSKLGRRDEALDATKRALEIRERLAKSKPDAFEPDLAMSLGATGYILYKFNENAEAQKSFEKGIVILKRAFFNNPVAFYPLMNGLTTYYIKICEDPDINLLAPILDELQTCSSKKELS